MRLTTPPPKKNIFTTEIAALLYIVLQDAVDWLQVILCLEIRELYSLYIHILYTCFLRGSFFSHGLIKCELLFNRSIWTINGTLTGSSTLGVMSMKGYSKPHKSPEAEPHHQMQYCVIPKMILEYAVCIPLQRDSESIFLALMTVCFISWTKQLLMQNKRKKKYLLIFTIFCFIFLHFTNKTINLAFNLWKLLRITTNLIKRQKMKRNNC